MYSTYIEFSTKPVLKQCPSLSPLCSLAGKKIPSYVKQTDGLLDRELRVVGRRSLRKRWVWTVRQLASGR